MAALSSVSRDRKLLSMRIYSKFKYSPIIPVSGVENIRACLKTPRGEKEGKDARRRVFRPSLDKWQVTLDNACSGTGGWVILHIWVRTGKDLDLKKIFALNVTCRGAEACLGQRGRMHATGAGAGGLVCCNV